MVTRPAPQLLILTSPDWVDYALLDSGGGMKLERYGAYRLVRPEAEAIWQPALPEKEWKTAHAVFRPAPEENGGHWERLRDLPERWQMEYHGLKLWAQTSASRHIGVFPEQASGWDWIMDQIAAANRPARVLNLFGYTGLASLAAAKAGAQVTHVDASPKVIAWARQNQDLSGLADRPVRWIVDDALKFVEREARRQSFYDGLVLDPPKFGRGPKGEVWEFYKLIPELLNCLPCRAHPPPALHSAHCICRQGQRSHPPCRGYRNDRLTWAARCRPVRLPLKSKAPGDCSPRRSLRVGQPS